MFTYLCKAFRHLHTRPKTVLGLSLILTILSLYQIKHLEIRKSFSDLFPQNYTSVKVWRQIENKFGGSGYLTLLIHSEDSASNKKTAHFIAQHLKHHPDINFLQYKTEADFYRTHQLLYISLSDLQEIDKRIETGFWITHKKKNPLLINLLNDEEKESSLEANASFNDLEKKYFSRLQDYIGTADGKVVLVRIYPNFDITDIQKDRAFLKDVGIVTDQIAKTPMSPQIFYTGEITYNVRNDGHLYSHILDSGKKSILIIACLLLLFFCRIPVGALFAIIPLSLAVLWTLALFSKTTGHLSLISGPLSLLLLGIGLEACIQLLARYREERLKGLSASIAFETLILETGPAITTSVLISAAAFLTLLVTDFKGFSEFGLMAGIGMGCMLLSMLVVFPCLLIIVERWKWIPVFGKPRIGFNLFQARPYKYWRKHAWVLIFFTLLFCAKGIQTRFEFNFDKLNYPGREAKIDSLLQAAGEAIVPPAVVVTPNAEEAQKVADMLRRRKANDTLSPTIQSISTMKDLLPTDQIAKLALIRKIKKSVTPQIIANAPLTLQPNLKRLQEVWNVTGLNISDLPNNYKKTFFGNDSNSGQFTFIFPSVNLREGWNTLAFANDVSNLQVAGGKTYEASGLAIVQADLLKLVIPDSIKVLGLAISIVFLLLLIDVQSLRAVMVILLPLVLSFIWTLGCMKWLHIKLNFFNLLAFPILFAYGINNSVHFYHRYMEEGKGSLFFVLRRSGPVIAFSTLMGMAGFCTFAFTDHAGLASLGQVILIGLSFSFIAPMLFMPFFIGLMEEKFMLKRNLF